MLINVFLIRGSNQGKPQTSYERPIHHTYFEKIDPSSSQLRQAINQIVLAGSIANSLSEFDLWLQTLRADLQAGILRTLLRQ